MNHLILRIVKASLYTILLYHLKVKTPNITNLKNLNCKMINYFILNQIYEVLDLFHPHYFLRYHILSMDLWCYKFNLILLYYHFAVFLMIFALNLYFPLFIYSLKSIWGDHSDFFNIFNFNILYYQEYIRHHYFNFNFQLFEI